MQQKEYKTFNIESLEQKEQNSNEFFYFEGYASVFNNVDYDEDVILKGAFTKSLKKFNDKKKMPLLWQHNMKQPIGVAETLKETEKGLYIIGKLPKSGFVESDVIPQVKIGSVGEMSIGFFVKDSEVKNGIRYIKEVDIFETSLVTIAANNQATIDSFKSANLGLPLAPRDTQWDGSKAEQNIREYTNSNDKPSADYGNYFMYVDTANKQNFGAYKLLFADIIDGKPHIVPRAVYAIAGALQGARGGLDVPEEDKMAIKRNVVKLYKKMATEFNDDSIVAPFAKSINSLESLKDVESFLKMQGLSNTEAKTLISKVKEFNQCDAGDSWQRDVVNAEKKLNELILLKINSFLTNNNLTTK